jgi:membrane-bound ClpP family serine protease
MAGMSWLAVPLGVFGCLMITFSQYTSGGVGALGIVVMMAGALLFLRGNRLKHTKNEERRHREMMEAIAKRDKA